VHEGIVEVLSVCEVGAAKIFAETLSRRRGKGGTFRYACLTHFGPASRSRAISQ
jgi:hypothetical protein